MKNKIILIFTLYIGSSLGMADPFFSKFKTVSEVQQALTNEKNQDTSRKKAALYSDLGTLYYRSSKSADAAVEFENALSQPTSLALRRHIYAYLGKCYESLGRWDKAISAYEQAAFFEPRYWRRHRDLAAMYSRVQLYDRAIDSYGEALRLQPKKPDLYFSRADVWAHMMFYEKAEESLKKAHEFGLENIEWQRAMSQVLQKQGRYGEALSYEMRIVGPSSAFEEQARLFFLAVMAGETPLAERTLAQMRQIKDGQDSLIFYQDVLKSFTDSPTQVLKVPFKDPTLKALVLTQ